MVIFNKELDKTTVNASDFQVTNPTATVTSVEVHDADDLSWGGNAYGNWSVVFLNLAAPLATDATPTVKLVGNVSTGSSSGTCGAVTCETITGQQVTCEDGIAPVLTLTTTPANPSYGQVVTVTLNSTETLSYCYDLCGNRMGDNVVVSADSVPVYMTQSPTNGKVWTGTFVNDVPAGTSWSLEAEACQCPNLCDKWNWKEAKCAEASLIFDGYDIQEIPVCEGWNLISVQDTLVEPSISKAFTRFMQAPFGDSAYGTINKVYYFTGGTSGTWQCSVLNPVTGAWTGPITTIDPGKAYFVWCDDWDMHLMMRLAPRNAVSTMPSIAVKTGWNMVGMWDITHYSGPVQAYSYFSSILTTEKWPTLWTYGCGMGWISTSLNVPLMMQIPVLMFPGEGHWLSVSADGTIYPVIQFMP
jgi:hypothetical protein